MDTTLKIGLQMINIENVKFEIIKRLKPLNPYKVILFGSFAYGNPTEDSDIDLYVVTNDEFIPKNWREKREIEQKVSKAIIDIMKKYPTDLITHTKAMHKKFIEMDSMFSRKILNDGIVILCENLRKSGLKLQKMIYSQ